MNDYQVITVFDDAHNLVKKVQDLIDYGYRPIGGVSCSNGYDDKRIRFHQAMVRRDL